MDYQVYAKKFQMAILILGLGLLGCIFLLTKVVPVVQGIMKDKASYKAQVATLEDKRRTLQTQKANAEKKAKENPVIAKQFFKPIVSGDSEEVIAEEFQEILSLLRANLIKARSINYEYDPADDEFVQNASDKYHVCRLRMELVADYKSMERFLQDLFKHEHFLNIERVEVNSYQKNKKILLVNMDLKLYAQK